VISKMTGADQKSSNTIIDSLAPMIMGALGKQMKSQNITANGLGILLSGATSDLSTGNFSAKDLMTKVLDQDGDGDIADDLVDMGSKFLRKFL
jgi:hypothetical protein